MTISIGCDHAGFPLKEELVQFLKDSKITVLDRGTDSDDSVDYPDFAQAVASDILNNDATLGILVCGTGVGISISANKIKGIRAALVYNTDTAGLARSHNDANVLCLGARHFSSEQAIEFTQKFIQTDFEGGRHKRRIDKINQLEN